MPIEFYPPQRKDADAVLWWQAVVAAGGTVSGVQLRHVSTLIRALKACGAWDRRDDYAAYCAENVIQARVTLKKRITQTLAHASTTDATFVASRGFLGNRDGYINTGWNPTAGPNYLQNDAGFGYYCYVHASPTNADHYMGNDATTDTHRTNYGTTNYTAAIEGSSLQGFAHSGVVTGLFQINRTASNAWTINQDNVQKLSLATSSVALVNRNIFVLAGNNANSPIAPTAAGISMAFYGGSLTAAQLSAEFAAWRAFLTACGVP